MTTKKQKRIIGIILLIVIVGIIMSQSGGLPFAISGTSTLSLTQAQLQPSNNFLDGKVWLLTFRAGGLNQRYFGSFSPSKVQDATSDNSRSTKSFSIEVDYDDQKCIYPITGTTSRTPIYDDIRMKTWSCLFNPSLSKAREKFGAGTILFYGKDSSFVGVNSCWAVGSPTKSPVGNINSPDIESEYEITINAGGQVASKIINSLTGSSQGNIGNFAYSVWQGNLVSGKSCPDKDPFVPIYVNGIWRTGNRDAYNTYKATIGDLGTSNRNDREIAINRLRNLVAQSKLSRTLGTINSISSFNNAVVRVTLQDPVQFPVTTLYIKAYAIGIFTPTPDIRLFSPSSDCFRTGEQGSINVGLENVGEDSGTWNLFAECQSPFSSTRSIQVSLQPGESVTRLIPLSASATKEVKGTCTIFAESPAGTKSLSVSTCVKPQITCTPSQKFCAVSGINEVIKKCSGDGATSQIIETCGSGRFCEDAECKVGEKEVKEGFFSKLFADISNFFRRLASGIVSTTEIIKFSLTAIVLIFGTLFGFNFFQENKQLKIKNKGLAFLVALVLGGILAYLVFTLFWTGVIISAIVLGGLIVLKIVKPF